MIAIGEADLCEFFRFTGAKAYEKNDASEAARFIIKDLDSDDLIIISQNLVDQNDQLLAQLISDPERIICIIPFNRIPDTDMISKINIISELKL